MIRHRLIICAVTWCFAIMLFYSPKAYTAGIPEVLKQLDQIQKTLNDQVIPRLDKCCNTGLGVPKTGQTVSRTAGDDGDLQKGVAWPNPRFSDQGNGTVTDKLTGLVWLKNANCFGQKTWADALNESNNLKHGSCGLTDGSATGDWRLPNIREIQSLIHYGVHDPALPDTSGTGKWAEGDPFTGVLCDVTNCANGYYWSNTTVEGSGDAYYLYLGGGFVDELSKAHFGFYVWPVRDPK